MHATSREKPDLEHAGQELFDYAMDREDIKYLVGLLPSETKAAHNTVTYELQLLKIVTIGWTISYHLQDHPLKKMLSELFWQAVQQLSHSLSQTAGLMIGKDIDYFGTVKKRLDGYVNAMSRRPEAQTPAAVIGAEFARHCGDGNDLFALMSGSKMFHSTCTRVQRYLEHLLAGSDG